MTSIKPSILRSVSPGERAACDGVSLPRVGRRAADAKSSANRVVSRAISEGRFIPREVVESYNDEAVRNAYNEVLATDYGGKRVKRSKYSEIK